MNPKNKKRLIIFTIIYFSLLFIYTVYRTAYHSTDFGPFWGITREILYNNVDLYSTHKAFSYPPFFYCLIALLAQFTKPVAGGLWYLLNLTMYTFVIIMGIKITAFKEPKTLKISYIIPVLLALAMLTDNLYLGQSNILVLFLLTLAFLLYIKRHDFYAGLPIACAIAVKLTPLLFLVYFIYKRSWKVVAGILAGLLLFLVIVPSFYFGWNKNIDMLTTWFKLVIYPFFTNTEIQRETVYWGHTNQSLDAFLHRHFTNFGRLNYGGVHHWLDIIQVSKNTIEKVSLILKVGIIFILGFLARNSFNKKPELLKYEFGLVIMAMLFISPSSWLSHYILATFPYLVCVNYVINHPKEDKNRKLLFFGLASALILTSTGVHFHLQSLSGMFAGHFILWITMAIALFRENKNKPHCV